MKNNKIILILLCVFILFAFTTSTVAAEDIATNTTDNSAVETVESDVVDENVNAVGETHVVNGSAKNQMNDPTIQTAINNAKAGDTIEITGTSYEHCHFVVDKQLTIISTVGTEMSVCPSSTTGSDGIGIFYITPEASGTILSGFTLINEEYKSGTVDPYGVYVNGASNVVIENMNITTTRGPGIYVNGATDVTIANSTISNSNKGIYVNDSSDVSIKNNQITSNSNAGIYIGDNCENLNIYNNTIQANNYYGIYLASIKNVNITNNKIQDNRDNTVAARAKYGVGIYVDNTVTNLAIKGNLLSYNGQYGVYNSAKFTNMVDQYVEIIDGNFFISHSERAVYHSSPTGETDIVYVWSNYYSGELFCGGTSYEPGVLITNHERDLVMSNITQIKKGVYSISFINPSNGEIATSLSSIEVIFYLNKKTNNPYIEEGDIARTVQVINGTAIADFRNETYATTGNTIVAQGPGSGILTYQGKGTRPSQKYNVSDSDIPGNETTKSTTITGNSLIKYYGNTSKYEVTLLDDDKNPIANQNITITINGKNYTRTTSSSGVASMNINLGSGIYNTTLKFNGSDEYEASTSQDIVTIKSTADGKDITKYYKNNTQYYATFYDTNGNLLTNTNVTFNINGVMYTRTTNASGVARLNINLNPANYTITALNPVTKEMHSNNIEVLSQLAENKDIVKYFKNGTQYTVKVFDKQGNLAVNKTVTFNINGVMYKRTTNDQGIATLKINLNQGDYIVTAEYEGQKVSNNITVLPTLKAEDLTMKYRSGATFNASLVDGQGNPLSNTNVTFNINGVFYNRATDDNGIARLNINLLAGKYIISSMYNGCTIANTITVTN